MKKKRKDSELWRYFYVEVLVQIVLGGGIVSGVFDKVIEMKSVIDYIVWIVLTLLLSCLMQRVIE